MGLKRRHFLGSSIAMGTASLVGCGPPLRDLQLTALPAALAEMHQLMQAPHLQSATVWSWPKTLEHLAQSIEYSITGYPQPKPAWFQKAVGGPALAFFQWRANMHHDLTEPIPGSPPLADNAPLAAASLRLLVACQQFMQWTGPLQPHFAYGALDHAAYEEAHAMHLANHFSAFRAAA